MKFDRRNFLSGAAAAAGAALVGSATGWPGAEVFAQNFGNASLPPPEESGIEHIVVVMMENRSFDHFLGWLPNAEGMQAGLTYLDSAGVTHATHALAPDFRGCDHPDPDHSYLGGRVQYDGGAMDGFLRSGKNDDYVIGYYVEADRPFFSALARNYTTLDHSFCSILGPTFPNRFFLHAAQTDRLANTLSLTNLPTIWDSLLAAGVSARYYWSNIPFLIFWGNKYFLNGITTPFPFPNIGSFLSDAQNGTLPAVSFVDPAFTGLPVGLPVPGTTNDDHPPADIRAGDAFLADTFLAVANGPQWSSTVFIVTYDEWGGFFDHVAPPRATAPLNSIDTDLVNGKALLGFRVPTVIASPFSRGEPDDPKVKGMTFDHTSILKLIEWRFGLKPLTARDASDDIQNLARALNFHAPNAAVPNLPHPTAPTQTPCIQPDPPPPNSLADSTNPWPNMRASGLLDGWNLPQ
jgi:phospholipase C